MPGLNGMGPQGNGPIGSRRFGRCRTASVPAQEPVVTEQSAHDEMETVVSLDSTQSIQIYGRGRGGVPCRCGRGFGFVGGRHLQE